MTFKQRVCGFRGHRSRLEQVQDRNGHTIAVRLKCKDCGYLTKTFWVRGQLRNLIQKGVD